MRQTVEVWTLLSDVMDDKVAGQAIYPLFGDYL